MRQKLIVVAAWVAVLVYAFPGYLNWDSEDQLHQARTGVLTDWHPPAMAAYWKLLDAIVRGPFLMLALQTALFAWGVHAAYRRRLSERAAAIATAVTMLVPPVLTPMAVVWKDAQMAGFLVAGVMLALRPSRRARIAGVVLVVLAASVRDNGIAAVPPLAIVVAAEWGVRRRVVTALAACAVIFGASLAIDHALTMKRTYPWVASVATHDIAGAICHAGPLADADVRALLADIPLRVDHDLQASICRRYHPRVWFELVSEPDSPFRPEPVAADRDARAAAWWRILRARPGAWLAHRAAVMAEVLGITGDDPWEPVCQTFAPEPGRAAHLALGGSLSPIQRALGAAFGLAARTVLYRPWLYVLGLLGILALAWRRRDGWVAALASSGLLYEASFFIGAAAPDFRYSHWMVTCFVIAAITIARSAGNDRDMRVMRA